MTKSKTLFRGDGSLATPYIVFKEGVIPKETHNNLEKYVSRNTTEVGNFILTSPEKEIAQGFAGKNGYVYEIEISKYIDVNNTLREKTSYPEQIEFSIPDGVNLSEIKSALIMKKGVPTEEFIPNPAFKGG